MASFTETATLKVIDESSAQIKAVNKALKALFKTANSLKSASAQIEIKTKGLAQATTMVNNLKKDVKDLKSSGTTIRVKADTAQAERSITRVQEKARRGILANIGVGAAQYAGRELLHATGRAIKEGTKSADIGETSLNLKQLTKEHRANVDKQIGDIGSEQAGRAGGAMWNRGQIAQQFSEMLGVVKIGAKPGKGQTSEQAFAERTAQAKFMTDQNLELARTLTTLGASAADANEQSISYSKALEQSGQIYNRVTGKLDIGEATKQYDQLRQLIPTIGKEATGGNFLSLMKSLNVSKMTLGLDAMAIAMANFEEMGTRAGVGMNQLISTVGRNAKKQVLAEQARLGLVSTETKMVGKGRRRHAVQVAGDMTPEDNAMLRERPQEWINNRLIPALKKHGATEANLDDPAWVANEVSKIWSDRSAKSMAAFAILQRKQNQQTLEDLHSRSGTVDAQREATKTSVIGATAAMENQFQGMMGQAVLAISPVLTPAMQGMSSAMQAVGEGIKASGVNQKMQELMVKGDKGSMLEAAGIGAAALAGAKVAMSQFAPAIGTASSLMAMTSSDPAVRAQGGAAQALISAADQLKEAAAALKLASGKGALTPDVGGDLGGGGDKSKAKPPSKMQSIVKKLAGAGKWVFKNGAWVLLGAAGEATIPLMAGAAAITAVDGWSDESVSPAQQDTIRRDRLAKEAVSAHERVVDAEKNLQTVDEALANARKNSTKFEVKRLSDLADADRKVLSDRLAAYNKLVAAAQGPSETTPMLPAMPKAAAKPFSDYFSDSKPIPVYQVHDKTGKDIPGQQVPMPMADPRKQGGVPASATNSIDLLTKANENLGASAILLGQKADTLKLTVDTQKSASDSTANSMTKLADLPSQFSRVFDGGAEKLSTAGRTATSDMQNGAAGIGAAIAAAFVAGASGVKVGVDTSGIVQAGYKSPANKGAVPVSV